MMVIAAKYSSYCPECRGIITAGTRVEWTPGSKPIHTDCKKVSIECIVSEFQKVHKKAIIREALQVTGGFEIHWTRGTDGKDMVARFHQNGERNHD